MNRFGKWMLTINAVLIAAISFGFIQQTVPIYKEMGGARMVIGSGGSLDIVSGGEIDIESGAALKIAGVSATNLSALTTSKSSTSAVTGFAADADTGGASLFFETQDGGVDTALDGGSTGGRWSVKTGDGSAGGADFDGAAGGELTLTAGAGSAGGAHTSNNPDGGNGASIIITAGAGGAAGGGGSGVAGDPGNVTIAGGVLLLPVQTIDMSDTTVVLTLNPGTPAGTTLTGNILYVDANGAGAEILKLPAEADCTGLLIVIENTGGETITIQNDAGGAVVSLETANAAVLICDGTTWTGTVSVP